MLRIFVLSGRSGEQPRKGRKAGLDLILEKSGHSPHAAIEMFKPLKFLAFTAPYDALLTDPQEVASLRGESSNQLLETLEEWNDYLEHYPPLVLQERPP